MLAASLFAAVLATYPVTKLHVNVRTGNDDLREGSEVYLLYAVEDTAREARLNPRGERWGDRTWSSTVVTLDPAVDDSDIKIQGLRFVAGRRDAMNDDQWEMNGLRVTAEDRSRTHRPLFRDESVRYKFTRSGTWRVREEPGIDIGPVNPAEPEYLEFELFTGRDDLRRNSAVHATFIFAQQYAVTEYIRGPIAGGGSKKNRIRLPRLGDHTLWRIELMMVEEGRGGTETLDHWDFDGIRVDLPGTENDYHNTARHARLAAGDVYRSPIIGSYGTQVDPPVQGVYVTILTGEDDLKRGSTALIQVAGPRGMYTKEIRGPLKARNRSFHYVPVSGIRVSDLGRITINPITMVSDGWTLKGLSVDAAVGTGPMMRVFEDWGIGQRIDHGNRWRSPSFRR